MRKTLFLFTSLSIIITPPAAMANENIAFEYDALGRLQTVTKTGSVNSNRKIEYQIDRANNRLGIITSAIAGSAPANRSPVAVNDTISAVCNSGGTFIVTTNDSDPDGDPLRLTSATVSSGQGSASVGSATNGTVSFNSGTGLAPTVISYSISDGRGGSDQATLTITKISSANGCDGSTPTPPGGGTTVNRAPVAVNDTTSVVCKQGGGFTVTTNDSDPDGDPLTLTSVAIYSGPGSAAIGSATGGAVTFSAGAGMTPTVIIYTISDGKGGSAQALLTVNKLLFSYGCG